MDELSSPELGTEEKILLAAEKVFLKAGYDGARMQEIANEAAINKAMLHYYFRSKDQLFEKIFDEKIKQFFPEINDVLTSDLPFTQKVEIFIESYIRLICKYPVIPFFVVSTVNKPDRQNFIKKLPTHLLQGMLMSYHKDLAMGKVKELNPMQFVLSVMGMCIFPFLAKPIITNSFKITDQDFFLIMEQRIEELKIYIGLILAPNAKNI